MLIASPRRSHAPRGARPHALTLDVARARFDYGGGAAPVALGLPGASITPGPESEIERQLKRLFRRRRPRSVPVLVVDAQASFELGLAYDYFIAGGDSIVCCCRRFKLATQQAAPILRRGHCRRCIPPFSGAFYCGMRVP
jgi:hypothetical protein